MRIKELRQKDKEMIEITIENIEEILRPDDLLLFVHDGARYWEVFNCISNRSSVKYICYGTTYCRKKLKEFFSVPNRKIYKIEKLPDYCPKCGKFLHLFGSLVYATMRCPYCDFILDPSRIEEGRIRF